MIAFSSVAQIGYIYMGIGMGTQVGMVASVFHVLSHAATEIFAVHFGNRVDGCVRGQQEIYRTDRIRLSE